MLSDDDLLVEIRRLAAIDQKLPTLLILSQLPQPASPGQISDRGFEIGFREVRSWNVGSILHRAARASLVGQTEQGWRMLQPGFVALQNADVQLQRKVRPPPSDSVLPRELFDETRPYLERVVRQINASYDSELYDCCAVMCRRIGETLIIEVYEHSNRAAEIKGRDGNFLMLSGLLNVVLNDQTISLGRNAKRGLEALKELGDKSAHNRRFNAREADIDGIKSGLRTAAEELLHLCHLAK